MIANVIEFDEERRQIQTELDNTLAESNTLSKEIGLLYKTGNIDEANLIKEKTVELKVKSKHLTERLNTTSEGLKELLYMIPNVPNEIVPSGNTEEDNEIVYVGYSKVPYKRRACHLSVNKFGGVINNSSVSQAITDGLLDRDKLTFEILEFVDSRDIGKQREKTYIMRYQPKINTYITNKKRRPNK